MADFLSAFEALGFERFLEPPVLLFDVDEVVEELVVAVFFCDDDLFLVEVDWFELFDRFEKVLSVGLSLEFLGVD